MEDKTCGTCIHYRCEREPLWKVHSYYIHKEYCAIDSVSRCGYCCPACNDYAQDQDYIDFMNNGRDA